MIKIANNACSWGVWFIDDPKQPKYDTYLDEFVAAFAPDNEVICFAACFCAARTSSMVTIEQ